MPAVYLRGAGGHVAERIAPEPGSDNEAELDRLAADPSSDWRKTDEAPSATATGPFDPAKHDVPSVLAYLAGAGADEVLRVLDAERAGKARKGILERLPGE